MSVADEAGTDREHHCSRPQMNETNVLGLCFIIIMDGEVDFGWNSKPNQQPPWNPETRFENPPLKAFFSVSIAPVKL